MNYRTLLTLTPIALAGSMAMAQNSDPVETLVVTATGSERSTLLAPASLSVISRQQLEKIGDQNILSALRTSAGISLVGRGVGGRKVIQLRGLESKHSLLLIDGKRISATDDVVGHSDFQYEWLPLDSIERIEVIRGPMSSLYGSEALGGVINIITRNSQNLPQRSIQAGGTLTTEDDGDGQRYINAQFNQALNDKLMLKANLGYRNLDDVKDKDEPRLSILESRKASSVQLVTDWQISENHKLQLSLLRSDEERGRHTNRRGGPPYYRTWYDLTRQQYALNWQANLGNWSGHMNLYRADIDVINHNDAPSVSPYTPQYLTDNILESRFFRDFGHNRLTLGGEWREEELKHSAFNGGGDKATHKSLLGQYEMDLTQDLYLTAGSRWDHHQYFGSEFSPRLYLVWELAPGLALKGGFGHGFKAPTLKQISPEYRFDGPHSFIGNPDLEPETSDSWELGLRYEATSVQIGASAYRNQVDGMISTLCIDHCGQRFGQLFQYVNIDETRTKGLELEASYQITSVVSLSGSYTFTRGENLTTSQALPNRPKHQGSIGLDVTWIADTLSSSLDWQYVGEQQQAATTGTLTLPNYALLNARLNYLLGNQRISLSLNNLTDTDLLEKSDSFGYTEPGRSVDLSWHWQF